MPLSTPCGVASPTPAAADGEVNASGPRGGTTITGGERIPAYTYRSEFRADGRKPSARYLGLLLDGCREHCLPAEWVAWLEGLPLAVDERLA